MKQPMRYHLTLQATSLYNHTYKISLPWNDDFNTYWENSERERTFYQALSREIINQPYVDLPENFEIFNSNTIFRPNHDSAHAVRQRCNTDFLLEIIKIHGHSLFQKAVKALTITEKAALELAAFLFRAARTNELGGIEDPSNAKRSAQLFSLIAKASGLNDALVDNISYCINHHAPIYDDTLKAQLPYDGYRGTHKTRRYKAYLIKGVLDLAHHSDLVRCWFEKSRIEEPNFKNFTVLMNQSPQNIKTINAMMLNFARHSCALTGTAHFLDDKKGSMRFAPRELKWQAVSDVEKSMQSLQTLAQSYLPYIKKLNHSQLLNNPNFEERILDVRKEEEKKTRAAKTIQRAWTAFRAHRLNHLNVGIHPSKVSTANLLQLCRTLHQREGLSNEEQQQLDANHDFLTPEEHRLYQYLLKDFPWVIMHATAYLPQILQSGGQLLSIEQRTREAHEAVVIHSDSTADVRDNIYFYIGSPNAPMPAFLQYNHHNTIISIPLRRYLDENNHPSGPLKHLWTAGSWCEFNFSRTYTSQIGRVTRALQYDETRYKTILYTHSNGRQLKRLIPLGSQVAMGAQLLPFLALNIIQELRFLDRQVRADCLKNPASKTLEAIVDLICDQKNVEMLLPAKYALDDPRISAAPQAMFPISNPETIARMTKTLVSGTVEALKQLLDSGISPNLSLENRLTPASYIASNHYTSEASRKLRLLLSYGASGLTAERCQTLLGLAVKNNHHHLVETLLETGHSDTRDSRIKQTNFFVGDPNIPYFILQNGDFIMLDILSRYSDKLDYNYAFFTLLQVTPETIIIPFLHRLAACHFNFSKQDELNQPFAYRGLKACLLHNKFKTFEFLLSHGMSPNVKPQESNAYSLLDLALMLKAEPFITLLKQYNALSFRDNREASNSHQKHRYHVFITDEQDALLVGNKVKYQHASASLQVITIDEKNALDQNALKIKITQQAGIQTNQCKSLRELQHFNIETTSLHFMALKIENSKPEDTAYFQSLRFIKQQSHDKRLDALSQAFFKTGYDTDFKVFFDNQPKLIEAIQAHDVTSIQALMEEGVSDLEEKALLAACDTPVTNSEVIDALFSSGYDPRAVFKFDTQKAHHSDFVIHTPLVFAVTHNNTSLIQQLIQQYHVKLNELLDNERRLTIVHIAILNQNLPILKYLVQMGADLHHPNHSGIFAFACFIQCNDEVFNYLIELADVNGQYSGYTALLLCAQQQNEARIKALLKKNVDVGTIHPTYHKKAEDLYPPMRSLKFQIEQSRSNAALSENASTNANENESDEYRYQLQYTKKYQHPQYDVLLANEYQLHILDLTASSALSNFFNQLLDNAFKILDCHLSVRPRIAIAETADKPVFTCQGFDQATIAIAKDFLLDESMQPTYEALQFAITSEVAFIHHKSIGERGVFIHYSTKAMIDFDRKILSKQGYHNSMITYLQNVQTYYKNHRHNHYFAWPERFYLETEVDEGLSNIASRIKAIKAITAYNQQEGQENAEMESALDQSLQDALKQLTFPDYFRDFPTTPSNRFDYLMNALDRLQDEFLPYQISEIPQLMLKQYCHLLTRNTLSLKEAHKLINRAVDIKLPSIKFMYERINSLFPEAYIFLKPYRCKGQFNYFGYFDNFRHIANQFFNAKTPKVAHKHAVALCKLHKKLKHHGYNQSTVDYPLSLEQEQAIPTTISDIALNLPEVKPNREQTIKLILYANQYYRKYKTKNASIPRALWILGVTDYPELYPTMSDDLLFALQEDAPLILTDWVFPLQRRGEHHHVIFKYFSTKKTVLDDRMLTTINIHSVADYIKRNKHLLITTKWEEKHLNAVDTLFNAFEQLLQGNTEDKEFVFEYFKDELLRFYSIHHQAELIIQNSLRPFAPYIKFIQKHLSKFGYYRLIQFLTRTHAHGSPEFFPLLLQLPEDGQINSLETLAKALNILEIIKLRRFMPQLVSNYLQTRTSLDIFEQDTYELICIMQGCFEPQILLDKLRFQPIKDCQLTLLNSIRLYRWLDSQFLFPNFEYQQAFGQFIIANIQSTDLLPEDKHEMFIELTSTTKFSSIMLQDRTFAKEVLKLWAEHIGTILSKDSGRQAYKIAFMHHILSKIQSRCSTQDFKILLDILTQNILSQRLINNVLVEHFHDKGMSLSGLPMFHNLLANFLNIMTRKEQILFLNFFTSPLNSSNLESLIQCIENDHPRFFYELSKDYHMTLSQKKLLLSQLHQHFWSLNLSERIGAMDSLIIRASDEYSEQAFQAAYKKSVDHICSKLFPNAHVDDEEALAFDLLNAFLNAAQKNERQFFLAGLMSANIEAESTQASIGKKFALLCEHLGPAYIKLAQAIHSHPNTPVHLKNDLAGIKGQAAPPYRWDLSTQIFKKLSPAQQENIARLGEILGSASYKIVIEFIHRNPDKPLVLALFRENAAQNATHGFQHITKTIEACRNQTIQNIKNTLLQLIHEAQEMSSNELSPEICRIQFQWANQLYNDTVITTQVENKTYCIKFRSSELIEANQHYQLLTQMPGIEFNELGNRVDYNTKKAIALAVVQKELINILSAQPFDCDRHGNQMRVEFQDNQNITLGLFDFGEMGTQPMSSQDIVTFAELLKNLPAKLVQNNTIEPVHALFQQHINMAIENGQPYRQLIRINKAFLALSDFLQYLKPDDFKTILHNIQEKIHPKFKDALIQGFITTLPTWKQWTVKSTQFLTSLFYSKKPRECTTQETTRPHQRSNPYTLFGAPQKHRKVSKTYQTLPPGPF